MKTSKRFYILVVFFALMGFAAANAQSFLPAKPVGMVNDFANMLTNTETTRLETKLRAYRDTTTNIIAIATLQSLQGYSRDEIATELFNKWRMWEGERFNGVLILIAEQERELKIEIGYGLEGAIPDAMANRIVQDVLIPNMRAGTVYAGLDRATDILIELAEGEFEGAPEMQKQIDIPPDLIVFFIFIIVFIIILVARGGGRNGGGKQRTLGPLDVLLWSSLGSGGSSSRGGGFSSGGGFGGFSGGGSFGSGGGGAGGSW